MTRDAYLNADWLLLFERGQAKFKIPTDQLTPRQMGWILHRWLQGLALHLHGFKPASRAAGPATKTAVDPRT